MSAKTWERNITGITAHAHKRKEQKRKGVEETITALIQDTHVGLHHPQGKR